MPKDIYFQPNVNDFYVDKIIYNDKILPRTEVLEPFYPSMNTITNTVFSSLKDVDETPRTQAQWRSVVWGRDRFAMVGFTNEVTFCKFSTDGTNWNASSNIVDSPLGDGKPGGQIHTITYSPELDLFVAGGVNDVILTSSDANTWTSRNYIAGGGTLTGAAWSPTEKIFVLSEATNAPVTFYTSNDGINWTKRTSEVYLGGYDNFLTWSKLLNKFITSKGVTSIDGINWTPPKEYPVGSNEIVSADEIGILVTGSSSSSDATVSSDHGKTWVPVNFDGDFATRSTRGLVWCKEIGIICAVPERLSGSALQNLYYSRDGFTWYKGPVIGSRQRCVGWSPELGVIITGDRDSGTYNYIRRTSLKTIPTIQNVFNSEHNSIDDEGQWSFSNVNITGNVYVNNVEGFTGSGPFTNFTIENGIITNAT